MTTEQTPHRTDLNDILKPHHDEGLTYATEMDGLVSLDEAFADGARHALTRPIILRTPEELDALPVRSVVAAPGSWEMAIKVDDDCSWCAERASSLSSGEIVEATPVELIRLPKEDACQEG